MLEPSSFFIAKFVPVYDLAFFLLIALLDVQLQFLRLLDAPLRGLRIPPPFKCLQRSSVSAFYECRDRRVIL